METTVTTERRRSLARRSAEALALVAAGLLLGVAAAESLGRLLGFLPAPVHEFQYDAAKGYELRPGGPEVNSHGLRDREYGEEPPPGAFRILVLGDSYTFGHGVRAEEAYPNRLEDLLNDGRGGVTYEVLNAGVPGYNTAQEVRHFEDLEPAYHPDLVLLGFTLNDAERSLLDVDRPGAGAAAWMKEKVKRHLRLYGFARRAIRQARARRASLTLRERIPGGISNLPIWRAARGESTPEWEATRSALEELARSTGARRVPILMVVFPFLTELQGRYPLREEHAFLTAVGRSAGMAVLDLLPAYEGRDPQALRLSDHDLHPNARGHEIAARAIRDELLGRSLLPAGAAASASSAR